MNFDKRYDTNQGERIVNLNKLNSCYVT